MPNNIINEFANKQCTATLRGLAILIILVGHVGVSGFGCRLFNPWGGIGVAMFLFLSGYGLTESYKKNGLDSFGKKKALRIAIPYLLWIPFYHIAMRVSPLGCTQYQEIIPRYWFIEYLILMYLVFYIIFKYIRKYALIVISLLGLFSFFLLPNLQAEQSFSFACGIAFSIYKPHIFRLNKRKLLRVAALFFIIGIIALLIKQLPQLRTDGLDSLPIRITNLFLKLPIGLSLILFLICQLPHGIKPLIPIGNISYELYLTHVPFFMSIAGNIVNLTLFAIQSILLASVLHSLTKVIKIKNCHHG